jgi:signal transduction histidine kinase
VDEVVNAVGAQLVAQRVTTDIDVSSPLVIVADRELMRRALVNLVLNALAAMPDGGELTIIGCLDGEGLVLEVADSGPGLSDQAGQCVVPSNFPSETSGRGLAIVHRVAEVHGGRVTAANCAQHGAAFTIRIPQRHEEAAA